MSIGNSVIKSLESDRTKLNAKIVKTYSDRQKMKNKFDDKINELCDQIDEINKKLIEYNKQNN